MEYVNYFEAVGIGRNAIEAKGGSLGYTITEALRIYETKKFDIFLSHSHLDRELVIGVKSVLEYRGYSVFVDWIHNSNHKKDKDLSNTELQEVARYLRKYMKRCKWMYYLHTDDSSLSRWCPWELGYFDCLSDQYKGVYVVPIVGSSGKFIGQEYLSLYEIIEFKHFGIRHRAILNESKDEFSGMTSRYLDSPISTRKEFPFSETGKTV